MKGLLVPPDLSTPISVVEHDGRFATMYPLVGTDIIEHVTVQTLAMNGHALYVDEEGMLREQPVINWRLTVMYPGLRHGQYLYGNGVIVSEEGPELDIVDMPNAEVWCERYEAALSTAVEKVLHLR